MWHDACFVLLTSSQPHGGRSCRVPLAHPSSSPTTIANNSRRSSKPAPLRKHLPSAADLSSAPPKTINLAISTSPPTSTVIAIPSDCGVNASSPLASLACKMLPALGDPGAFPPDELTAVVILATSKTDEHDRPATRWTLD